MLSPKTLVPALLLLALPFASAFPRPAAPTPAPGSGQTCGSNYYSASQISAAASTACNNVKSGNDPGGYPHQYNDYEGFKFGGKAGPYQEFPILESGIYTGGSPGADRVIITSSCEIAGVITHTGASGNNFVGCSGTS